MRSSIKKMEKTIYYQKLEAAPTISEINPNVTGVRIETETEYRSFGGTKAETYNLSLGPNDKCFYTIPCPNEECTEGYFNLSSEILSAVKSGVSRKNKMRCRGQEEKYKHTNGFHCEATLTYSIEPILSSI